MKRPIRLRNLIICTTEELKKEVPATMSSSAGNITFENYVHDIKEPPGFNIFPEKSLMIRTFSVNPPLLWKKQLLEDWNETIQGFEFENILIKTEYLDAIKAIYNFLIKYKRQQPFANIILSDISYNILYDEELTFLNEIKNTYKREADYFKSAKREKLNERTVIERIKDVAASTSIPPLERRLFLYFLGKQLKAVNLNDYNYILFNRNIIADEFSFSLKEDRKSIIKSIDRLIKKKIIRIIKNKKLNLDFFHLSDSGPIDLIPAEAK